MTHATYPTYVGITLSEQAHLNKLIDQGRAMMIDGAKTVEAELWVQGRTKDLELVVSFTVAILNITDRLGNYYQMAGVAKRNFSCDDGDDARGRLIALSRAACGKAVGLI
jgi:hypothetical protein